MLRLIEVSADDTIGQLDRRRVTFVLQVKVWVPCPLLVEADNACLGHAKAFLCTCVHLDLVHSCPRQSLWRHLRLHVLVAVDAERLVIDRQGWVWRKLQNSLLVR